LVTKCYYGDQIEGDEMGRACGMYLEKRNVFIFLVWKPVGPTAWKT
jgi:hypothetical protein